MRRSLAVGLGLALVAGGAMETQGNFEAKAEGHIPFYVLDPTTPVGSWVEEQRLAAEAEAETPAEQAVPESPAEGDISEEKLETLLEQVQTGVSPRCPEESSYQYLLTENPNSQICLDTEDARAISDKGQIVFSVVPNPASGMLVDVAASLNHENTPAEECDIAVERLTGYGEYLIEQTGVLSGSEDVSVLINLGDCGTYQPEPVSPRPGGRAPI